MDFHRLPVDAMPCHSIFGKCCTDLLFIIRWAYYITFPRRVAKFVGTLVIIYQMWAKKNMTATNVWISDLKVLVWSKISHPSFDPSDFKTVFAWHLPGKILNWASNFIQTVFFEGMLRISRSAITRDQDWLIGPHRYGSRKRWRQRLVSLKLQSVAYH